MDARAVSLALAITVVAAACRQADQALPFAPVEGQPTSRSIGQAGGAISIPPGFSLQVPEGALSGDVFFAVVPRTADPFPASAGVVLAGTEYDVGPAGLALALPARIEVRVPAPPISDQDLVRLALGSLRADGSVSVTATAYDVVRGVLQADVRDVAPVAAVLATDVLDVGTGGTVALAGGTFDSISPPLALAASCEPVEAPCATAGALRVSTSGALLQRLGGGPFVLLAATVDADLDILSVDAFGRPTSVEGTLAVRGALRARVGDVVSTLPVERRFTTGPGASASPTAVSVTADRLRFAESSDGADGELEFSVSGAGSATVFVIRLVQEVELSDTFGSAVTGAIVLDVRLGP